MIGRVLLAVSIFAVASPAEALWELGGGIEAYRWVEYPAGSVMNPKETGPRVAVFGNWTQEGDRGVLFAWRAKLYAGSVDYDTYVISSGAPVSTTTDYSGAASEGQAFYRYNTGRFKLDQVAGLGVDTWRRRIRNSGGDQIEDYSIMYLRAGLRLTKPAPEAGFHAEAGLKYPIATRENAHLDSAGFTTNPKLTPKGALSAYAEIGYRINARFDVLGYYDSWRFKRSDDVLVTDTSGSSWLVHQPESHMDAVGVKLLVSF